MKPSRLDTVLSSMLGQRWPAFIWGPPGIGKSAIVHAVASKAGMEVIDLRASLLDPTDLRGIPAIIDQKAVWCPPGFLPQSQSKPGVLFLDEINAAPPMVQASLYQLVLDRKVGEYVLPEGWWIVAAGNRQKDRAITFRMSSALSNRFVHLELDVDVSDWRAWALKHGIYPMVVAFIGYKPALLREDPSESPACWRRRQIDPVCRFHVNQRDDLEPVGGLGIAATKGGSVKSRHLGQICVGANTLPTSASTMTSPFSPLTDEEVQELDEFLLYGVDDDKSMTIDTLDGYLHAIAIGPTTLAPSVWMPPIWGSGTSMMPAVESIEQLNRILELVMRLYNNIIANLEDSPPEIFPHWELVSHGDHDYDDAEGWAYYARVTPCAH